MQLFSTQNLVASIDEPSVQLFAFWDKGKYQSCYIRGKYWENDIYNYWKNALAGEVPAILEFEGKKVHIVLLQVDRAKRRLQGHRTSKSSSLVKILSCYPEQSPRSR